ncbi:MAG: ABC transporter [Betaproteobacteria bacterium RIFCSPLOWO2_12_FULL_62_13]|nr:MAG: ABC transporter [Betaproteobacteria bacterium RIFCSPLOWO2_12_FULL_62_13]
MATARTSAQITLAVWKALFLREAVNRLSRERLSWLWVLLEPMIHIVFLMFLFEVVRIRVIGGINTVVWVMVGMLAFFMFRRPGLQAMNAVGTNQPLFGYRQVKPVDPVLVRAGLEGFLMLVITVILLLGAGMYGYAVVPADPMSVMVALLGLWLVGVGFGLAGSVAVELVPELGWIISMAVQPLYFFSGVIFPIAAVPQPYRDWLLINPLVHGLEVARLGFAPHYQALPDTSIAYLYGWALVGIFSGLALHIRFARKLAAR